MANRKAFTPPNVEPTVDASEPILTLPPIA
jgi:hypothetical protein